MMHGGEDALGWYAKALGVLELKYGAPAQTGVVAEALPAEAILTQVPAKKKSRTML